MIDDDDIGAGGRAIVEAKDLATLLTSSLGREKSEEEILSGARTLGIVGRTAFTVGEARSIIRSLATKTGIVGVVARFAISRGEFHKLVARLSNADSDPARDPREEESIPSSRNPIIDITPLLAPSLGAEKAREVVTSTAHKLGFNGARLTHVQALRVLETVATMPGLAGVVARFAKASLTLGGGSAPKH